MKLPVKRIDNRREPEPAPAQEPQKRIYEVGGFGVLIQTYPVQEHWVKECKEGRVVRKRDCGNQAYRRNAAGEFFYLLSGDEPPILEDDMIPSVWKKGEDYEESSEAF